MSEFAALPKRAPSKQNDGGVAETVHTTLYHEMKARAVDARLLADGLRYWVAQNPTPGTGIISHAAPTATDQTKPLLGLKNNNALGTDLNIYLHRLVIAVNAAPGANATSSRYVMAKSAANVRTLAAGSTNIASSGIAVLCPKTTAGATAAQIRYGAVTTAADTSEQIIASGFLRSIIPKIYDRYLFSFGAAEASLGSMSIGVTTDLLYEENVPPVVIGPQETFLFCLVNAAQDAASTMEFRLSFEEDRA